MKSSNQLLLLGVLSALSSGAAAADDASSSGQGSVDTSKWKCELCKFEQGTSGTVDYGAANVSKKSAKFGDYTGLNDKREYFIGDGSVRSRDADGTYWNLNASNLGLDSRSLDAEGGRQGKYKLLLKYDELPHFISDSALTPFSGSGGASLTLPPGFVRAPTTAAMPLAGTLQQVDLETKRKRLGVGASWIPVRDWEYAVNFREETKEGSKRTAGSFFFNSSELVQPIDYVTDQIDASASYTGDKLQVKFAYYGSLFHNRDHALTWQDPYTAIIGESAGQLALSPDNQFHQLSTSVGYQISDRTRASADVSIGRMTQNDTFLASTLTRSVLIPGGIPALPGSSLNGRADTVDVGLKLSSAYSDRLRLNAALTYNDRHNDTPQASYAAVTTDMFLEAPRTNLPYSFKQGKLKLSADYKASASTKASVGYDYDQHERTFQEVDKTHEDTFWGKISYRMLEKLDLAFKLAHGERRNSGYQVVPGITPPENPLLRKFNMANRTRDTTGLRVDLEATENINIGVGFDWSEDKYSDSSIGLTDGKEIGVNGDVSVVLTERTSLHLFASHQEIRSTQAGSQTFSVPDWSGENKDTIDFFGLGVKHAAIKDKLDIGADVSVMHSRGEINVNNGATVPPFPNLTTSRDTLKLYATYRLKENMSLQGGYWYERYDSRDWMLDGVAPATIPNVLSLGLQPPQYHVNVVRVSISYKF